MGFNAVALQTQAKRGFIIKEVYNLCRALFYVEENQLRHKTCSRAVYMGNIYNEKQTVI